MSDAKQMSHEDWSELVNERACAVLNQSEHIHDKELISASLITAFCILTIQYASDVDAGRVIARNAIETLIEFSDGLEKVWSETRALYEGKPQ